MTTTQSRNSQLEACIEACLKCLQDCEFCATACLDSDPNHAEVPSACVWVKTVTWCR